MQCTSLVIQIVTKINQVLYQMIEYNDNGMFTAKLMNDTPIEIFIDNSTTPSILPLCTFNNFPILHTYPKTESNTPIHTGGGLITSHFWLEIPLKLQHQTIQIKALVCDSECPYDLILGRTSMAQLSVCWSDTSAWSRSSHGWHRQWDDTTHLPASETEQLLGLSQRHPFPEGKVCQNLERPGWEPGDRLPLGDQRLQEPLGTSRHVPTSYPCYCR